MGILWEDLTILVQVRGCARCVGAAPFGRSGLDGSSPLENLTILLIEDDESNAHAGRAHAHAPFRYLFNGDPLAAESVQRADFCALFDLEIDYAQFLSALEEIGETAQRQSRAAVRVTPPLQTSAIRSSRIDEVVRSLARIDMASLVRRQTVWQMLPTQPPDPVSDEIFISLDRIRKAIGATVELTRDRQLLHDLMLWLDKHLLATVARIRRCSTSTSGASMWIM